MPGSKNSGYGVPPSPCGVPADPFHHFRGVRLFLRVVDAQELAFRPANASRVRYDVDVPALHKEVDVPGLKAVIKEGFR